MEGLNYTENAKLT